MRHARISDGCTVLNVAIDNDDTLALETLKAAFPEATGLYSSSDTEKFILSVKDGKILNHDGWTNDVVYLVHFGSRSFQPNQDASTTSIRRCFQYLHYALDGNYRFCITIIDRDIAVTAYHCVAKKKVGDIILIFDQNDQPREVKILYFCQEVDLAMLQPIEEFNVNPLPIGTFEVGRKYFALGYPIDEDSGLQFTTSPSVVTGSIMTKIVRKNCMYGNSGASKGFSGGPVISIDCPPDIVGIALGGRGIPKSWPLSDFLIRALTFCGETPRLKILPATSVMALYTTHSGRKSLKRSRDDDSMDNE